MAEYVGKIVVCDRCGEQTFAKFIKQDFTDGGFAKTNHYANPSNWGYSSELGMKLCPQCLEAWRNTMDRFKHPSKEVKPRHVFIQPEE